MTVSTVQELPNRVNSGGGKATVGSTTSADTNDPVMLDHDGEHYVKLAAASGNYLQLPDEAAFDVAGDFEVLVRAYAEDWHTAPGGFEGLVARFDTGGSADSFFFRQHSGINGRLEMGLRQGAVNTTHPLLFSSPDLSGWQWIKCHVDVDDGGGNTVVTLYKGDDGPNEPSSWTLLDTSTTATAAPLDAGNEPLGIGTDNVASRGSRFAIKRVIYRDLDGGSTDVADVNLPVDIDTSADPDAGQASFTATTGQTVTVNRGTSGLRATVVTRPVAVFDGTDDYLQLPTEDTPTFTKTTGKHTVVVAWRRWLASATWERLVSFETAANDGLLLGYNNTDKVATYVGDGTAVGVAQGAGYTIGDIVVSAAVVDDGTLYVYQNGEALASVSMATIATEPEFMVGRVGAMGYSVASLPEGLEVFALLTFKDLALTKDQLDTLAIKLINGDYT